MVDVIPKSTKKLDYVDSLRGIACLCVVNHHFWVGNECHLSENLIYKFIRNSPLNFFFKGLTHVFLFFVLSGRVLCESAHRSGSLDSIASAAVRRPFRLFFPVFLAAIFDRFLSSIDYINLIAFSSARSQECPTHDLEWKDSTANFTMHGSIYTYALKTVKLASSTYHNTILLGIRKQLGHGELWSIPLELFYSYVIYIIALVFISTKHGHWFLIFIITTFSMNFFPTMLTFLSGYILCYAEHSSFYNFFISSRKQSFILAKFIIGIYFFTDGFLQMSYPVSQNKSDIYGPIYLFFGISLLPFIKEILEDNALKFLGLNVSTASY